ncbi:NADH:flavin oxidoreductase/NADH oxidase [Coprinopsis sp. MPI-PUGE-AT-0042]|nr:NADH:flavin oxidoreductase/NADH oxidase [Coprinopsis sp. MPI-PUGE-AT-0042]
MGSTTSEPKLFEPIRVGTTLLKHRVVFAPCTRVRADPATGVPDVPLMKTYYEQRASVPGTLIVTEGTFIAQRAGGFDGVPGIWSDEQVAAWKEITDAVHAKGSCIFVQLWALGRAARLENLRGNPFIAPSPIKLSTASPETPEPREMTVDEIKEYVGLYTTAAKQAVAAGFDGVEIHGANGYLVDQFLQDVSNKRTDSYGGSIENRARFGLEVVSSIANAIGEDKTAIRLSPWGRYQDMKMDDPVPQFEYFISQLAGLHSNLAYIHLVEPGVDKFSATGFVPDVVPESETNDHFRKIWAPRAFISCGNYTRNTAIETAEKKGDIIAFGRHFITNPDLPFRLKEDIKLNGMNEDFFTLYVGGERGYTDYPFAKEFSA